MKLKELILKYITAFNNQDLSSLRLLFNENIHLKDWEVNENGIDNVIKANQKIFKSAPNLNVKIHNQYLFEKTAICVLKINVDNQTFIDVVDIIEVDDNYKIISIRAYKG